MTERKNKAQEPQQSRRALFTGMAKRSYQSVQAEEKVQRTVPRPPNAVDEDIFTRLCNQCGECERACPESVIRMENGFPTLDVEYSHCTLCGKCQAVCPTIALSNQKQDTGLRAKASETCINLYGYCDSCGQSCPSQALKWRDNQIPTIDMTKCTGCGICKSDCFIGAIQLR